MPNPFSSPSDTPSRNGRRRGVALAGSALLVGAALTAAGAAGPAQASSSAVVGAAAPGAIAGAYIVVLRDGADAGSVAAEHARTRGAAVGHVYRAALRGYSATMSATAAGRIARDPRVASVQADRAVSIDAVPAARPGPGGGGQVQTVPTGVRRIDGPGRTTAVDVAVIDTGIDLDHPDLNVYTPGAVNCSRGRGADDGNGHGTHVAGTIGAVDNGIGVVGVAPGARLWPVRVLDNRGSGSWSSVVCGIDYVTAHADRIEVANLSLGGDGTDSVCGTNTDVMHDAICAAVAAGVTVVVAAGNESDDAANHTPAAYDEVITVSALADFNGAPGGGAAPTCRADVDDTFADFSNFGADVDLIAPGACITSTWLNAGYNTISGTSMASPHVAGAAALVRAASPAASPAQVKAALQGAGTLDWNLASDPDPTHERLLNVAGL